MKAKSTESRNFEHFLETLARVLDIPRKRLDSIMSLKVYSPEPKRPHRNKRPQRRFSNR